MRHSLVQLACGFLLAIAGLPLTGCTLIGYAIGSGIDAANVSRPGPPVPSRSEMEDGDLYRVVRIDSSIVIGEYLELPPPDELYDQWRAADSTRSNMPRHRDSVQITLDTPVPRYLHGRLDRISADSLWVVDHGWPRPPTRAIPLQYVRTLTSTTGGRIEGPDLRKKAAGMVLPRATTTIGIDVAGQVVFVPIDSIAHVDTAEEVPSTGRIVGGIVGLCVDVAVIVVFSVGLSHMYDDPHWR